MATKEQLQLNDIQKYLVAIEARLDALQTLLRDFERTKSDVLEEEQQ